MAGDFHGEYTEDDFDIGQQLPTPYHQTKFEAEMLVRSATGLRYRIYRPAVVVGDSRTGEMDKIDGPYYFFGTLAELAVLPRLTPMMFPIPAAPISSRSITSPMLSSRCYMPTDTMARRST